MSADARRGRPVCDVVLPRQLQRDVDELAQCIERPINFAALLLEPFKATTYLRCQHGSRTWARRGSRSDKRDPAEYPRGTRGGAATRLHAAPRGGRVVDAKNDAPRVFFAVPSSRAGSRPRCGVPRGGSEGGSMSWVGATPFLFAAERTVFGKWSVSSTSVQQSTLGLGIALPWHFL